MWSKPAENSDDRRNVRMSVQIDCCERDALIAAEFFTVFQKLLGSRFPRAIITGRQYDREKYDYDEPETEGRAPWRIADLDATLK